MASQASNDTTPNAKQLVFLFMAATVVAVVVFLCGVLVGRGVPSAGRSTGPALGPFGEAALDENARRPPILDVVSSEPSAAASSGDDLSYYRRLVSEDPVGQTIPTERDVPAPLPPAVDVESEPVPSIRPRRSDAAGDRSVPSVAEVTDAVEADRADAASAPPLADNIGGGSASPRSSALATGAGYTVQVTALRGPDGARQVAVRLLAKGFPAYVLQPASDAPVAMYRVRVGRYIDRGEAEQMLQRLEREEQFKPWITR